MASQSRLFAGLYLWFYTPNKDKNTTVRISVKRCIYGWKIDFCFNDSWLLKDKPLKIILSCKFPCTCSEFIHFCGKINLGLSEPTVCWALSLVLCAKQGQKYHCSNKRKTLYLWMENRFLFQRFMAFERQAAQNNPFM